MSLSSSVSFVKRSIVSCVLSFVNAGNTLFHLTRDLRSTSEELEMSRGVYDNIKEMLILKSQMQESTMEVERWEAEIEEAKFNRLVDQNNSIIELLKGIIVELKGIAAGTDRRGY